MADFVYSPLLPLSGDTTEYRKISSEFVSEINIDGRMFLKVEPAGLELLAQTAFEDVSHLLRPSHLAQVRAILDDEEATQNDRFVALEMLKNAVISSDRVLPMCQDTGTALVTATRGEQVLTGGEDAKYLSKGIYNTYQTSNLRYSQLAPLSTGNIRELSKSSQWNIP